MSVVGPRPQTKRCFEAFPEALQRHIVKVRPGLSGIGSIIFREEEDLLSNPEMSPGLYDNLIMPYKGEVEAWYVENRSLSVYFITIFTTAWVVIFPSSGLVWKVFKNIPAPPAGLSALLHYPNASED